MLHDLLEEVPQMVLKMMLIKGTGNLGKRGVATWG